MDYSLSFWKCWIESWRTVTNLYFSNFKTMTKEIPLHVVFVEAWIKKDDKYLLAKRSSKDDQAAGTWAVPWGKIEIWPEKNIVENSLKREVLEEVWIEIFDVLKYFNSWSFFRSSWHHVVGLSFLAKHKSGEALPLDDQEEVRWVTIAEMRELLSDEHWQDTINKLEIEWENF